MQAFPQSETQWFTTNTVAGTFREPDLWELVAAGSAILSPAVALALCRPGV